MKMVDRGRSGRSGKFRERVRRHLELAVEPLEGRRLMTASQLFDFGYFGPVAPGAVAINLDTYSPAKGYGWTAFIGYAGESGGPDPLLSGINGGSDNSFRIDLPNGIYSVTADFGDYGGYSVDDVSYAGQSMASSVTAPGRFFEPTFQAAVTDGEMTLNFTNDGNYYPFKLNGLRVGPADLPTAAIAGMPATSPAGTPITLTGSATEPSASVSTAGFSYAWSVTKNAAAYGSGAGPNFTFTPDDVGTYAATLVATDKDGVSSKAVTATVAAAEVAPTAQAGGPYAITAASPLKFQGSGTDPAAAIAASGFTYLWDFGDGSRGSGANPAHTYTLPGTYDVGLEVVDKNGGIGKATSVVTVSAPSPEGSLLFDFGFYGPVAPGAVAINLDTYSPAKAYGWTSSMGNGSESGGPDPLLSGFNCGNDATFRVDLPNGTYSITAYFGDYGGFSADQVDDAGRSLALGFTSPGQFFEPTFQVVVADGEMTLDFNNDNGSSPFKLNGLKIQAPIAASAGPPQSAKVGDTVSFAGAAFPGLGSSYAWNFGDGTGETGELSPRHVYEDGGVYTAKLTVTDGFGDAISSTSSVSIADVAPTASISGGPTTTEVAGTTISLGGSATDPSTTDQAAGYAYAWSVVEGGVPVASGTGPTIAFIATTPGAYTASLTATDKHGLSGTSSISFTTVNPSHLPTIRTPNDTIPNFVAHPTIVSVASGNWSNPATWSTDRVPTGGDIVEIASGTTVSYDVTSVARLQAVGVDPQATLTFRADISTEMYVTDMVVFYGGTLQIGTAVDPVAPGVTAMILFNNVPVDTAADPSQYGNGLIALGTVTIQGALKTPTFQPLGSEAHAGDATLELSQPEAGWRPGDQVYLPDSTQMDPDAYRGYGIYSLHTETATIAGISPDGETITLTAPLAYDHLGGRDARGNLVYLPDVVDMTRNVVIRSESGIGTRGQAIFTGRADVDIEDAEFVGLGRTTEAAADDTTYDAAGNVTHLGTNEDDRNAVQFRDLVGPATPQPDGYQYTFANNILTCPVMNNDMIWPININNSSYGLIRGNAVVNWAGAGIITRTGAEVDNMISDNFVSNIRGTGDRFDFGREGAGFWLRGPDNHVVDDVATDISGGVYSYGFVADFGYYLGTVAVPAYQGADPSVPGQSILVNMNDTPLLDFSGDQVYGKTPNGLTYWWLGTFSNDDYADARPSVIEDFQIWHVYQWGIFGYQSNNLTIDGFIDLGDSTLAANGAGSEGFHFEDYLQVNLKIANANVQGQYIGIGSPDGTLEVDDSYLNNIMDICIGGLWTVDYTSLSVLPRTVIIRDVAFADFTGGGYWGPSNYIDMVFGSRTNQAFTQLDTVLVYDFDRIAGDDFQCYYAEQDPSAIVPETTYNADGSVAELGAPVAGLTNAEAWQEYGIAVAGKVATNATTRAKINGLVGPIS